MKTIKIKSATDIPTTNFTGIVEFSSGTKIWYLNGKLHRETGPCTQCKDCLEGNFEPASGNPEVSPQEKSLAKPKTCSKPGPAVIYLDGEKRWFLNGELHNEHGPATIYPDGTKYWYLNDKIHNDHGPAVVCPAGEKRWFLNGEEVDFQAFELYYMLKYYRLYNKNG